MSETDRKFTMNMSTQADAAMGSMATETQRADSSVVEISLGIARWVLSEMQAGRLVASFGEGTPKILLPADFNLFAKDGDMSSVPAEPMSLRKRGTIIVGNVKTETIEYSIYEYARDNGLIERMLEEGLITEDDIQVLTDYFEKTPGRKVEKALDRLSAAVARIQ